MSKMTLNLRSLLFCPASPFSFIKTCTEPMSIIENVMLSSYYDDLPMQYTEIFSEEKKMKISFDFFFISYFFCKVFAQNIHCVYSLEPPRFESNFQKLK